MRVAKVLLAFCYGAVAQIHDTHSQQNDHMQHARKAEIYLRKLREAVQLTPSDAHARLLLGAALLDQGEANSTAPFEALRQLRRAAELAPRDGEYAYQLGRAYQRASEWSVARIKAVNAESARLYLILGESYAAEGKTKPAIEALQKALSRAPTLSGVHLALAVIYSRSGDREQALRELEQELTVSPGSESAKAMKQRLAFGS